jgi:hypothetical protein
MSAEPRQPTPEAVLIRRAREAVGLSPETAAKRCDTRMSGRRWRQIEAGEESKGGKPAPVGNSRLAHMAYAVGIASDELRAVGREEAGEILARIERRALTTGELVDRLLATPPDVTWTSRDVDTDALRKSASENLGALAGDELAVAARVLEHLAKRSSD